MQNVLSSVLCRVVLCWVQVKESLLIMTQHNMASAAMPTEREMRRARANSSGGAASITIRMHYTVSEFPMWNMA